MKGRRSIMIAEYLEKGVDNAKSGRELCALLGITARELSKAVEVERRQGQPICASSNGEKPGYYLAANKQEMHNYCRSLWHRAGEIHKTRRACLQTMGDLPGELLTDGKRNSH